MKKIYLIFTAGAMVCALLFMTSVSSVYAKKRDLNCLNRCLADKKVCFKKARNYKFSERLAAENECRREHTTCTGLCPDAVLE